MKAEITSTVKLSLDEEETKTLYFLAGLNITVPNVIARDWGADKGAAVTELLRKLRNTLPS